jgi:very-short-patch-repair endonuclease
MDEIYWRIFGLALRQHKAVARWQLTRLGMTTSEIETVWRGLRRVHQGVRSIGPLSDLGRFMTAALALGPSAVVSHRSALMLLGLLPREDGDIHVSVPGYGGRRDRDGLRIHRQAALDAGRCMGVPVTSPSQALNDADLERHELYRALEEAEERNYHLTLPLNEVVRLQRAVQGRTRSNAEAQFLLLCHDNGIRLPQVNHRVNGIEADFQWPEHRVVLEVDGWEFHKERTQFEEDRRRELVHAAAGYQVIRASGLQVFETPDLVVSAVRSVL